MVLHLERVVPLASQAVDSRGRTWFLASIEVWSERVVLHAHCLVTEAPRSPEAVHELDLAWQVVSSDGAKSAGHSSSGWVRGVWSTLLVTDSRPPVTELRGFQRDHGAGGNAEPLGEVVVSFDIAPDESA